MGFQVEAFWGLGFKAEGFWGLGFKVLGVLGSKVYGFGGFRV